MKLLFSALVLVIINLYSSNAYLRVQNKEFFNNNDNVFLSGTNIAWISYARDFGSGAYNGVKAQYQGAINEVSNNGGNVIRVWVHTDGSYSPKFDGNGYATGADTQSLINELGQMLDYAASKNVFVILCLWNLAVKPTPMINLYTDDSKLQSYLNKVLKPLATGLKNKPALAAYDIINEPSGSLATGVGDSNPCFDTKILQGSGADWTGAHLKAKDVLRFINLHADAIKSVDPKVLLTIGDNPDPTISIGGNTREYYSDNCLRAAGGKPKGIIDFYQLHTYTWQGKYSANSPLKKSNADYRSSKPIIIGEFATVCSENKDAATNMKQLYNAGYAGALNWQFNEGGDCSDKKAQTNAGMSAIKDMSSNGKIRVKV